MSRRFWRIQASIVVTEEGGEEPDFTGLTAGSAVGVVGSGGSLPTGWEVSGTAVVEVLQATNTDDGIECIQIKLSEAVEEFADCVILFPNGSTGMPAAENDTWKVGAYLREDASTLAGGYDHSLSLYSDQGSFGGGSDPFTVGGDLGDSYREVQNLLDHVGAVAAYSRFSVEITTGSITLTIAMKLEQVS